MTAPAASGTDSGPRLGPSVSRATGPDDAFNVTGGAVRKAKRSWEPGLRARFTGWELRSGMECALALAFLNQLGGRADANPVGTAVHDSPAAGMPRAAF